MPTVRLDMSFKAADGKSNKISIDDAKTDVTEVEVNSLMDLIISSALFEPSGSPLAEKVSIELITTDVVEFNIV